MAEMENNYENSENIEGVNYEGDEARGIISEMETSYLDYAMSVIIQRALPDVRDGTSPNFVLNVRFRTSCEC